MNRAPTRIRPAANRRQLCREAIPTLRCVTLTDKKDSTWCCPYLEVRLINPVLNAVLYSAWQNETIKLPLDSSAYKSELQDRIDKSTFKKREPRKTGGASADDFAKSF